MNVSDVASKFYNELLGIYLNECEWFSDAKMEKMKRKHDPINLTLDTYDYTDQLKNEDEESADITRTS